MKIVEIDQCWQCRFKRGRTIVYCQKFKYKDHLIQNIFTIPSWCPLESGVDFTNRKLREGDNP